MSRSNQRHSIRRLARRAFSLIEVVVTMTILAIIVTFAAPSVLQSLEQSHADLAGASLRMINAAQRFYWLENRTYAPNLQTLIDDGLLDSNIGANAPRYEFSIANADADGFVYRANVNTAEEMTNMMSAARSYQNNIKILNTTKDLLLRTLNMGR